ncbi:TrkH family potassium uptake protein [Draconibacterium sediminis]|uniref:Potassium transporter n=1 Tax=Draconibacterium sediminis TaxID=1544798 RepID=A0A0D8JA51_9BACT|nr:TrkH family potassium uptake protein [Draconibacterium sediminis]KJF43624.1 potassium transporter [Draconibacterium sediminis]
MDKIINFRLTSKILSRNVFIVSLSILVCSFIALIYSEPVFPFLVSFLISLTVAAILFLISKQEKNSAELNRKDAYFAVTSSWILMTLLGSLPYLISGSIPVFVDALFESVSGFTTTGSSILTDIEALPKSILFWRSLTHWIGGIGIIVLVILIMPTLQIGGYQLFTMESSLQEKIHPKIKSVGQRILAIYMLLTAVEVVLLLLGKMNLFDSVCHAFGTIATGGFSPKNTSITDYSPYIQYVIMIFMLLAGTNFVIHYYILKREFRKVKENEEMRFYFAVVSIVGLIITLVLFFRMNKPFEEAFREAFFQVISIVTCTGFASADYLNWPVFAWVLIFLIMFLGGSTGSTAGGIKMARHLVLLKNIRRNFREFLHPHAILHLRINGRPINDETNRTILSFISIYVIVFVIGSILIVATGVDIRTASSSVATCMAGIGPGIGTVGPASNFAHLPANSKVLLSILMIIGRLEIYTVIVLFTKKFWEH